MGNETDNIILQKKLRRLSKNLIRLIILLGFSVLIGWQFDISFLIRPFPGLPAMNPVTAVLFIFSGFSFLLFFPETSKGYKNYAGYIPALIVFIISLIKITSAALRVETNIDHFIFPSKLSHDLIAHSSHANAMAPSTAFCFLLISLALPIFHTELKNKKIPAQYLALAAALLALFSVIGYIYQVEAFYGLLTYIPMALHSAIGFLVFSVAIFFATPDKGLMKALTSTYTGSENARFLIPAAILIPILLGYLRMLGNWYSNVPTEFSLAILMLCIIIIFVGLIWLNSTWMNKKDMLRKEAEEKLAILNKELESRILERTEKLKTAELEYSSLIEQASDGIFISDNKGRYIDVNPSACKMLGYTKEELLQLTTTDLISKEDIVANPLRLDELRAGKTLMSERGLRKKDGTFLSVEISGKMLENGKMLGMVRDITERKKAEALLAANELLFRQTLDNLLEGIQIHDFDWKYTYVNDSLTKYSQYPKEELLGYTLMEKYPGIEHSELFKIFEECMTQKVSKHFETQFSFPNGVTAFFELSVQPIATGLFILSFDITERKINEEKIRLMNEELEQKVKDRTIRLEAANKELEAFSYSISHDLRAPLRAIDGYAKILEEDYCQVFDQEGKRLLGVIQQNSTRMRNLIDDLLEFSRLGRKKIQKTKIDMQALVENAVQELQKPETQINVGSLLPALGDFTLINQVVLNLLSNSIKYSSKKTTPVIDISSKETETEVIYKFKDNGAGFNMEYSNKLFGVFQRLHSSKEFEGTGVGLAIVHRIAHKHGGKVWAESVLNEGASFYFSLPK